MDIRPDEISALIKERIKNYGYNAHFKDVGKVLEIGDGIAKISGLEDCMRTVVRKSSECIGTAD